MERALIRKTPLYALLLTAECVYAPHEVASTQQSRDPLLLPHRSPGAWMPTAWKEGSCPAARVLERLGRDRVLVGVSTPDDALAAPFDIRYIYIAGGLPEEGKPCRSCKVSCDHHWWGCWQSEHLPPGQHVREHIAKANALSQIPMITYYQFLHASGEPEGEEEIRAAIRPDLMTRYYRDWRFLLQTVGRARVLLHLEPDFWGYAQRLDADPERIPVAVASVNPVDCSDQPDNMVGFGACLIHMARRYAPNALIGLHASAFASGPDVLMNRDPTLDVPGEALETAAFLRRVGATEGDFIVVEASDRDADYYRLELGRNFWWDETNATLPSFEQAFTWVRALTGSLGLPALWWQLPVGNAAMPNTPERWKDNRVAYFFAHPDEVARTNSFAMVFGPGAQGQTTPSTDDGFLLRQVERYVASGGQCPCPPRLTGTSGQLRPGL